MIGLLIVLALALGTGGVAVVSDNARPGDALFGVDRAVENVRISFAGEERKNELRVRFAEERVAEVKELEAEGEVVNGPTEELTAEQEAEVALGIETALDLLTELNENSEVSDARLEALAAELSTYLDELPANARVQVSDDRLRIKFDQGPEKIEIKEQGENKTKIEVRTEESRLRVEVKDGQIEIKTKVENNDSFKNELKAEAEILSDKTVVEVEVGYEKTTFATTATTEEGIVAAIVAKFPNLSATQVKAVLKIKTEDRDDDEDNNDDKEDDDDDKDEDRSGSNSGRDR